MSGSGRDRNARNGNGAAKVAAYRRWRSLHLTTGLVVALWLAAMAVSGVLINHHEALGLDEIEIRNRYLPSHYTDEFHPETTRLLVVVTDLHSGRFFGERGRLVGDAVAVLVLVSIASGLYAHRLRRRLGTLAALEANGRSPGTPSDASVNAEGSRSKTTATATRRP